MAYILWLLIGMLGVHRIYAGRTGSGIAQAILSITIIGLIVSVPWVLIDAFLIPGLIARANETMRRGY